MEKLIGIFSENSVLMEAETFEELKNRLGLTGGLSECAGNVELYKDDKGITYAIAHDNKSYYGRNEDSDIIDKSTSKEVNEKSKAIARIVKDLESGGELQLYVERPTKTIYVFKS